MKRLIMLVLLTLLLAAAAQPFVSAQDDLIIKPTNAPADYDGDGIPDEHDKCPKRKGPRENRGCPVAIQVSPTPNAISTPTSDDLVSIPEDNIGVLQGMKCYTHPGTTIVSDCWCQSSDSECVAILTSICWGGGAYLESGPNETACWWD